MNTAVQAATAAVKVAEATVDLSSYPKLPTGAGSQTSRDEWNLSNTVLGCGLLNLQGWSTGIGIGNNSNLEDKLFIWSYYSAEANQSKYPHDKWGSKALDGSLEAPISVSRRRYQFLSDRFGMVFASNIEWVKRLDAFVKEHGLGDISYTHTFKNKQYGMHEDAVGLWNWNGKHPDPAKFPHVKVVA